MEGRRNRRRAGAREPRLPVRALRADSRGFGLPPRRAQFFWPGLLRPSQQFAPAFGGYRLLSGSLPLPPGAPNFLLGVTSEFSENSLRNSKGLGYPRVTGRGLNGALGAGRPLVFFWADYWERLRPLGFLVAPRGAQKAFPRRVIIYAEGGHLIVGMPYITLYFFLCVNRRFRANRDFDYLAFQWPFAS